MDGLFKTETTGCWFLFLFLDLSVLCTGKLYTLDKDLIRIWDFQISTFPRISNKSRGGWDVVVYFLIHWTKMNFTSIPRIPEKYMGFPRWVIRVYEWLLLKIYKLHTVSQMIEISFYWITVSPSHVRRIYQEIYGV